MSAFDQLIKQIDSFIRKYYKSELLKGLFLVLAFLVSSFLVVSILEFFGRFSSYIRFVLLFIFCATNLYLLVKYFFIPLAHLFSYGKQISHKQAARIIGTFFPTISDRLLNTLELNEQLESNHRSYELIRASVSQRSNHLLTVRFEDAIKFEKARRILKYLLPILLVFLTTLIFVPQWVTKGSSSVIHFNKAQEAPFQFLIKSKTSPLREGDSYQAVLQIDGLYIPEYVFIESSRGKFQMKKTLKNEFVFEFQNLKEALQFKFLSEGFYSDEYKIPVYGNASIGNIKAHVTFPKYIYKKDVDVYNMTDLELPEGSNVTWFLAIKNASKIQVKGKRFSKQFNDSHVQFSQTYKESEILHFFLNNKFLNQNDSSQVQVQVIKDAYPSILVSETVDSVKKSVRFFQGLLADDYGIRNLNFVYSIKKKSGKTLNRRVLVDKYASTSSNFSFAVDFSRDEIQIEDKITYHFEVSDNDGVNGSKVTSSQSFVFELPTLVDLNKQHDEVQNEVKNALSDVLKRTEQFKKDITKFQKSLVNSTKTDFKNFEQLNSLQQQQQQLQQELKQLADKLNASNEEKNKLSDQEKELLEQQELIEKLLNDLMDDELKKLLEDMQKLLQENNKQLLNKESIKLESTSEEKKRQLDRTLEMLKRMQVNEKIDDISKELKELSEKQEQLSKQVQEKLISNEKANEKQQEIDKEYQELQKKLDDLNELNQALERPLTLDTKDELQQEINNDIKDAQEKLAQSKSSKASQSQKNASQKMKDLANSLQNQKEQSTKKQNQEDMQSLRILLENLIAVSLNQEYIMKRFSETRTNDPIYNRLGKKQRSIMDDARLIEDSLIVLAKRQPKIAPFIDSELSSIKSNFNLITEDYRERKKRDLSTHQQYVMTGFNNLALMLNESLQSLQQQAQQEGSGSCETPGGSGKKPSSGGMSMEQMKQMLQKQMDDMKKGLNPGGKEPGSQPGEGIQLPGMSNMQLSKMAMQQAQIRQQLEQLRNELNKDGSGMGNKLSPLIKELEQQEKDIVNNRFSRETYRRQQDILTRLLESEKALHERGFEEKRESKSPKNENFSNLIRFDEYKKSKMGQVEMIRHVSPTLTRYYKNMASQYFNTQE